VVNNGASDAEGLLGMAVVLLGAHTLAVADDDTDRGCSLSAKVVASVQSQLAVVVNQNNGGIFSPNRMWSAVVDRRAPHGLQAPALLPFRHRPRRHLTA
jgi:hypothetical protein